MQFFLRSMDKISNTTEQYLSPNQSDVFRKKKKANQD